MNRVFLSGMVTSAPVLRMEPGEIPHLTFALSVRHRTRAGEFRSETYRMSAWYSAARWGAEHLARGQVIGVQGYLTQRKIARDGSLSFATEDRGGGVPLRPSGESECFRAGKVRGGFQPKLRRRNRRGGRRQRRARFCRRTCSHAGRMTATGFSKALKGGDSIDFVEAARLSGEGGELRGRESEQNLAAGAGTGDLGGAVPVPVFPDAEGKTGSGRRATRRPSHRSAAASQAGSKRSGTSWTA